MCYDIVRLYLENYSIDLGEKDNNDEKQPEAVG